jgi:hypothetical protein
MALPSETIELEQLIGARTDKAAIVTQLLKTVIVVPVNEPSDERPDQVSPLTVERGGHSNVFVFTTAEGAEKVKDNTSLFMTMSGTSLILRMSDGLGLLLFSSAGNVAFEPSLLTDIRTDMRALAERDLEQ